DDRIERVHLPARDRFEDEGVARIVEQVEVSAGEGWAGGEARPPAPRDARIEVLGACDLLGFEIDGDQRPALGEDIGEAVVIDRRGDVLIGIQAAAIDGLRPWY